MIHAAKPMIDLLMLLLLLFSGQQIATTAQYQDITVSEAELLQSEATHDVAADRLRRISFSLLPDGSLLFEGKEIALSDLIAKARAEQVVKVHINIDNGTSYIQIREVIRGLSDNGLSIELG